jgi:pyruvate ferredoxin oxidoreductase delta subunit
MTDEISYYLHPWIKNRPITAWLPPGYSRINKTGANRYQRPEIDDEKCTKCGICWICCPEGAIGRGKKFTIDYEYCRGCGICLEECPLKAIRMIKEV